jgi:hypothetical protein
MLAVIDAKRATLIRKPEIEAYFEVQTTRGVVDVVLAEFDEQAFQDRKGRGLIPLIGLTEASVVHALAMRRITLTNSHVLANHVGVSAAHLRRAVLPNLRNAGWLRQAGTDEWSLAFPYVSPLKRIIAIEVKRTDWRRALVQAASHVEFADVTYVALDGARGPDTSVFEDAFVRAGVGLIHVTATRRTIADPLDANLRKVIAPSRGRRRSIARTVVAERVTALRQSGSRSGELNHVFGRRLTTEWGSDPRIEPFGDTPRTTEDDPSIMEDGEVHLHPLGERC